MSGSHLLRSYAHLDSPVHRLPGRAKLLVTVLFVVGVVLIPVKPPPCKCGALGQGAPWGFWPSAASHHALQSRPSSRGSRCHNHSCSAWPFSRCSKVED